MSKNESKNEGEEMFGLQEDSLIDLNPTSISPASGETFAVFEDDEGDFNALPVILFGAATYQTESGDKGSMVVGMVSMSGGLEVAEHMEEMSFIGYWRRDLQKMVEFLEDHGIEVPDGDEEEEGSQE